MITKFLKNDLYNGIILQWPKFVITVVLFVVLAYIHYLDIEIVNVSAKYNFTEQPTVGDYFIAFLFGREKYVVSEIPDAFEVPVLWFAIYLWFLFITLSYPYTDLTGYGKYLIVLSKRRGIWWLSKCIWGITTSCIYTVIALLITTITSIFFGAEPSLRISSYLPTYLGINPTLLLSPPWNIKPLLLMFVLASISLCMMQLVLSLCIKPLFSYSVMSIYLLVGTYFQSPFLLGNYLMAARSEYFVVDSMYFLDGVVYSLLCIVGCMIIGYFLFENKDILNKE